MINRLKTFATDFINTGFGLNEDYFMREARLIVVEENLEWPIYRRLVMSQCAIKIFFSLAVCLAMICTGTIISSMHYRRWSQQKKDARFMIISFSFMFIMLSGISWAGIREYINHNIHSSFLKILLSLDPASQTSDHLWDCLQKHGVQIDSLDLSPSENCTDQEKKNLCLTDDKAEAIIKVSPNLTKMKINSSQLTMHSLSQFYQKTPNLTSLELLGSLDIPDRSYEFLIELKQLRKLKIEQATHLTQEGFASICKVANSTLTSLHLGSSSLDRSWLEQFCAIQDSPSELGFYSPSLHPLNFKMLFQKFKARIRSISFIYNPIQDNEISQLIRWLDSNIGWNGEWYRYINKGICKIHFVENKDTDSD
jgi:hypothetical protein